MGIRYYAYPVPPAMIAEALDDPCRFHGDDPLMDAWGPEDTRPVMLYLDKCWREMQAAFNVWADSPRPAAELVRGAVTFVDEGAYHAFERTLTPEEVAAIADDLDDFVVDHDLEGERDEDEDEEVAADGSREVSQEAYFRHYVLAARDFCRDMATAGYGLAYLIG